MTRTKTIIYCLIIFSDIYFVLTTNPDTHDLHEVNICKEEQKFRCKHGDLISVKSLVCGNESPCPKNVNRTIFDLCQGQQTCSNLGIAEMLPSQCKEQLSLKNALVAKFTCAPGSSPSCLSNICAELSEGLTCPEGSLIHIRGMTCGSVTDKCPLSTYANMYVCEGVDRCASSGLKALLPQNCQQEVEWRQNVIVQYICVPEKQIDNTCMSGMIRTLDNEFGILRSPTHDPNSVHTETSCRWRINSTGSKRIKVVVHLINGQVTKDGCDHRLLSIATVDCTNGSVTTRSFCDVSSSGTELLSCGEVLIRSLIPHGQESADAYVVSYQRYSSDDSSSVPSGLPSCLAPSEIHLLEVLSQSTTHMPSSKTSSRSSLKSLSVGRNYGPGDGMFEYRDSLYEEDAAETNSGEDSNPVPKQLRLMVLYIFFGVVILVLAVALIAVIVSYRRISKFKSHSVDSSEKTALWQHNEDTPLDTFLNHNMAESSGTLISETTYAFKADHEPDQQVVATVHHDAVSEPQLDCGNGVSTFLAGKRVSDVRSLTNNFQACSFAPTASLDSVSNIDQNYYQDTTGSGGYVDIEDKCHYDIPNVSEGNIYEFIELGNTVGTRNEKRNSHPLRPEVAIDKHEDKHYEVTNHDPSVVGLQHSPSENLHYHINNDEYAVVIKTSKAIKFPNITTSNADQQKLYNQSGINEFCSAAGQDDRQRMPTVGVNARWSNEDRGEWTDDL